MPPSPKHKVFAAIAGAVVFLFIWLQFALVLAVHAAGGNFKEVVVKAANQDPAAFWFSFTLMVIFGLLICYTIFRGAVKRRSSEPATLPQKAVAAAQTAISEEPLSSNS